MHFLSIYIKVQAFNETFDATRPSKTLKSNCIHAQNYDYILEFNFEKEF